MHVLYAENDFTWSAAVGKEEGKVAHIISMKRVFKRISGDTGIVWKLIVVILFVFLGLRTDRW